jgi:hypothetical protein
MDKPDSVVAVFADHQGAEAAAVKADSFLVMAHGTAEEMARAKAILGTANASRLDVHTGMKADQLVHAGG